MRSQNNIYLWTLNVLYISKVICMHYYHYYHHDTLI